jgi:hypothetical protein
MKSYLTISCLAALILTSLGCAGIKSNIKGWSPIAAMAGGKEKQFESDPVSMAVIWKDSVYEKPGVPSVKGFGGRVFLYDSNNDPIKADGELIVYGYDESNPAHMDQNHAGADKKFVFPRENFQQHYSRSDLGASYSVWIPWEKMGSVRKSITLIPVFKTSSGGVLRCGQSINVLPGKKPDAKSMAGDQHDHAESGNVIAQASFQKNIERTQPNRLSNDPHSTNIKATKPRLRTTTLNLPPSLAKKLAAQPTKPLAKSDETFPRPNKPGETTPTVEPAKDSPETSKPVSRSSNATKARIFGVPGSF